MINLTNNMLFKPKELLLFVTGLPFACIWIAWYLEAWNMMIFSLLLVVPIMIITNLCLNKTIRARIIEISVLMSLYLPLVIFAFSKLYEKHGLLHNGKMIHSIRESLYFSVVTWTTLGYGDFQPSETIRLWAAGEALFGYVFMALLIALLINLIVKPKETV